MTPDSFPHLDRGRLEEAAEAIRALWPKVTIAWGAILGSGQVGLEFPGQKVKGECSMAAIPGLGAPTVAGHEGRIRWMDWAGTDWIVFLGRRHWYEGEGWLPVLLPLFLMRHVGANRVLLLNAAGGIRQDLAPGDLVLIRDHLNLMGDHPLRGPHQPLWGPRFPDLTEVYSSTLREWARAAADQAGVPLKEGVYAGVSGPSYETPAEVRFLASIGADLVGMSTVPEAIAARSLGLEVLALSLVTNRAAGLSSQALRHEEVVAAGASARDRLSRWLGALASSPPPPRKGAS